MQNGCSELGDINNQKLIELLMRYNRAANCPHKSSKPRRATSAYFEHVHEPVMILQAPKRGELINASRKGFRINHTIGDAVPKFKHVDAVYCKDKFHTRYDTNPGIHEIGKLEITPYENMPVIARWDLFGYFFLGKISRILSDSYADVRFNNGHKQINLSFDNIIFLRRTKIMEGDYVMVNIMNELDQDCWVPGMVQAIDHDAKPSPIYYVLLYDESKCTKTYGQLLRISREQYYRIREFILFLQGKGMHKRDRYFQKIEFEYELDLFGDEYKQLKFKYQPIIQPSNGPYGVIPVSDRGGQFGSLRAELSKLKAGDRCLARWPDDGWYYPSVIRENRSKSTAEGLYKVENKLGATKYIYREDLIHQIESNQADLKLGDTVVAQHPKFSFAYAPGEVCRLPSDTSKLIVRFYDFAECLVAKEGIYRLVPRAKFEADCTDIIQIENYWVGKNVLAFNSTNREYEWGKILGRIKNQRQMLIQWRDGQQTFQNVYYIFTSKDQRNLQSSREHEELVVETSRSYQNDDEILEEYEEDKYVTKKRYEEERGVIRVSKSSSSHVYHNPSVLERDRSTPVLDFSEFFASRRRAKTLIKQ